MVSILVNDSDAGKRKMGRQQGVEGDAVTRTPQFRHWPQKMRKRVKHVSIVLVALLAVWAATRHWQGRRAARGDRRWLENWAEAERNADDLRQRIETEVAALPNHDWAGEYHCGDGLGENISLYLAPRAGYLYENRGCEGVFDVRVIRMRFPESHLFLMTSVSIC